MQLFTALLFMHHQCLSTSAGLSGEAEMIRLLTLQTEEQAKISMVSSIYTMLLMKIAQEVQQI